MQQFTGTTLSSNGFQVLPETENYIARFSEKAVTVNPIELQTEVGCFPREAMIATADGFKRMDELRIGDTVADVDATGRVTQTKVYAWLRLDRVQHEFVHIRTESGRSLRLTPNHLIFRQLRGSTATSHGCMGASATEHEAVLASELNVGDTVFSATAEPFSSYECDNVTSVKNVQAFGAYAPATMSGTLLVDGVHVSCYTSYWLKDTIGHYFIHRVIMAPLRALAHALSFADRLLDDDHNTMQERFLKPDERALWFVDMWKVFRSKV
ncbi:unnamed protein product [Soboliphyme baturini]|uniref:HintN domain-containing protein n=1 Tax=Soboliphyme baturini TaxID=241478 RepID=A0A183IRM8_9BILA|nr:unnamed protein product [Soboliphyme baturini]